MWYIVYIIFSFSVVYIKEELNCDIDAPDAEPAVSPSDIRSDGAEENANIKKELLGELVVKKEPVYDYLVSKACRSFKKICSKVFHNPLGSSR